MRKRSHRPLAYLAALSFGFVLAFVSPAAAQLSEFRRGDANTDGMLDASDAVATLLHLFADGFTLGCLDAADVDDSGTIDIADVISLLDFLFIGAPPPAAPGLFCGPDPTDDPLDCAAYAPGDPDVACTPPLETFLLEGDDDTPAIDATRDVPPTPALESDITADRMILTRIDVFLDPDATVGHVNAALAAVGARIVSMAEGARGLTVAVPRQVDAAALFELAQILRGHDGIASAFSGREATPLEMPPDPAGAKHDELEHLIESGFPAAWNARGLLQGCTDRVRILVADFFGPRPAGFGRFSTEVPHFQLIGNSPVQQPHGYNVTTTVAAAFDELNPTGANPFSDCLEVAAVNLKALTPVQFVHEITLQMDAVIAASPSDKFILNTSFGFRDRCAGNCDAGQFGTDILSPLERAEFALYWTENTRERWPDFLVTAAGGNERDRPGTTIYPGLGNSRFSSMFTLSTEPIPGFGTPFESIRDSDLWEPRTIVDDLGNAYPSFVPSPSDFDALQEDILNDDPDMFEEGGADNVIIAGASKIERAADGFRLGMAEAAFSDENPDLWAVGENILMLDGQPHRGTSYAAPQVAGLASYLWLLSPELRAEPSRVTRRAILDNTRAVAPTVPNQLDAYAAVLSLDRAELPTPTSASVRLAILDVDSDGDFDETDLGVFVALYFDTNGLPVEPTDRPYGRLDLNGDGFTGGTQPVDGEPVTRRFDLDRVGSTRFGETVYGVVEQDIEGRVHQFNENALTDLDILCYYAYSALYTGDEEARFDLIGAWHDGIATGDERIESLDDVARLSRVHTVVGNLTITERGGRTLPNLDGLTLRRVEGNLRIQGNFNLESLEGLGSLEFVGGSLTLATNSVLPNLNGLESLTEIGGDLRIQNLPSLKDIDGLFGSLQRVGGSVFIVGNVALLNIDGLGGLREYGGDLAIQNNFALESIDGLLGLERKQNEDVTITNNASLSNLNGLLGIPIMNLLELSGESLADFSGLSQLEILTRGLTIRKVGAAIVELPGLRLVDDDISIQPEEGAPSAVSFPALEQVPDVTVAGFKGPLEVRLPTLRDASGISVGGFQADVVVTAPNVRVDNVLTISSARESTVTVDVGSTRSVGFSRNEDTTAMVRSGPVESGGINAAENLSGCHFTVDAPLMASLQLRRNDGLRFSDLDLPRRVTPFGININNNIGFSDQDARDFVDTLDVEGTVDIFNNQR